MAGASSDKHTAILDAAYSLFGSKGFYETKMSEVAEQAGIAKGTVYLYFKSKEELFTAVTRRDCDGFLAKLRLVMLPDQSLETRLALIADHVMMYYFKRRHHTKLFFRAPNNDPELMAFMAEFMKRYMTIVVDVLAEGGCGRPDWLAQSFIGMLERLKMDILFDPAFGEEDARERARFATELFLKGALRLPDVPE